MGKSLCSKNGNDNVQTPYYLAQMIVKHFKPRGRILEPCAGAGNFLTALKEKNNWVDWYELNKNKDFLTIQNDKHWDWIITNPPYSKYKEFLMKSMKVADRVVFLIPLIHIWTKARLKIMRQNNFAIKELFLIDTPKEFPQMGFQFGCVYYKRNYKGSILITEILKNVGDVEK